MTATATSDEIALRRDGSPHARLLLADHLQEMGRDREACVERIAAEPWNDLWRLQWADWLARNGQAEYAEFVRVQCAAASLPWLSQEKLAAQAYKELCRAQRSLHASVGAKLRRKTEVVRAKARSVAAERFAAQESARATVDAHAMRLLHRHEDAFRCGPACERCFPKGSRSAKQWEGGNPLRPCESCNGTGDAGGLAGAIPFEPRDDKQRIPVAWWRGCPERVACLFGEAVIERRYCAICAKSPHPSDGRLDRHGYCARCDATRSEAMTIRKVVPTEWARRVCRWHPVLELWPTDREPHHYMGAWNWFPEERTPAPPQRGSGYVPQIVVDEMVAGGYTFDHRVGMSNLRSRDSAMLALATALARLARKGDC